MRTASSPSIEVSAEASPHAAHTTPLHLAHTTLATPVGALQLFASERGLLTIALPNESREEAIRRLEHAHGPLAITEWTGEQDELSAGAAPTVADAAARATAILALAVSELRAYFTDRSAAQGCFTVPLDLRGTSFQRQAWLAVADIPSGATRTYSEIAQMIGRPAAVRAVGAANGANPLPIIIPCHRVIGADGTLTGYGGGLPMKRWLLDHEGVTLATAPR
ncbi:MAG TPA: methylated-DNA--[protein]-cysteine S-methyltransferase [Ktedonobacterales bacterium]|nr:methylated-DNA--[protein]-cysteine S-methyltransferase [Ktedonobacterales bacterium]